jgi:hypothetical protein
MSSSAMMNPDPVAPAAWVSCRIHEECRVTLEVLRNQMGFATLSDTLNAVIRASMSSDGKQALRSFVEQNGLSGRRTARRSFTAAVAELVKAEDAPAPEQLDPRQVVHPVLAGAESAQ